MKQLVDVERFVDDAPHPLVGVQLAVTAASSCGRDSNIFRHSLGSLNEAL